MSAIDEQSPLPDASSVAAGRQLNVAVLGAGGTIAPAIVRDLADSEEVASQLLLDVNADQARMIADTFGGDNAEARAIDARDRQALAAAAADCDVLVNSANYHLNLDVMRACLDAGCHYIDLGGLYHTTIEQLKLSGEFAGAGLLALLGMGSAPGKTNVMAAAAVEELGGSAEHIMITAGGRDLGPDRGFAPPYSVQTIVDELTMKPVVLREGEPVEIEPMKFAGVADFPEPIGEAETIYTLHSELVTFGDSFGGREVAFRLSLPPAALERLRELTTATREEIAAAQASAVRPSDQTVSIHMIDALTENRRINVTCVTSPMPDWGLGGGVVSTAAPAAAAVRLLARGQIDARGALPPERCVTPELLFPELERRGAKFELRDVAEDGPTPGAMK